MDKTALLCEKDKIMLTEFSRRVVARVTGKPFRLIRLPFLGDYLNANVGKEVEKDRIIITRAAEAFAAGKGAHDADCDALFEETKAVDRAFVKNLIIPSFSIAVRYEDFADIRKKRIELLWETVHAVLSGWNGAKTLDERLREVYTADRFKATVTGILHLYNLETRMLSRSIRFFPPFQIAMHVFAETLFDIMESSAGDLADCYAKIIYQGATADV